MASVSVGVGTPRIVRILYLLPSSFVLGCPSLLRYWIIPLKKVFEVCYSGDGDGGGADRGVGVPLATLRLRGLTGPSRFLTLSTHLFAEAVGTESCGTSAAMNRGLWVMEGWKKVLPGKRTCHTFNARGEPNIPP